MVLGLLCHHVVLSCCVIAGLHCCCVASTIVMSSSVGRSGQVGWEGGAHHLVIKNTMMNDKSIVIRHLVATSLLAMWHLDAM